MYSYSEIYVNIPSEKLKSNSAKFTYIAFTFQLKFISLCSIAARPSLFVQQDSHEQFNYKPFLIVVLAVNKSGIMFYVFYLFFVIFQIVTF